MCTSCKHHCLLASRLMPRKNHGLLKHAVYAAYRMKSFRSSPVPSAHTLMFAPGANIHGHLMNMGMPSETAMMEALLASGGLGDMGIGGMGSLPGGHSAPELPTTIGKVELC
jgi:hypothetical protein